ncbi:MAG: DUF4372 domain-containing protein [Opitutus sp.]|nr:DUF4372 domain-containing protein [Opitutus sp.]
MNLSPTVFAQILAGLDANELSRAAARFPMPRASRALSAYDHFAAMVFGQLTYRESLRGIEACLRTRSALAYRMGIRGRVTRTNLAYANEHRDWRVFADVAAVADAPGATTLCRDTARTGIGGGPVRLGCDRHRTEHGAVPVGKV